MFEENPTNRFKRCELKVMIMIATWKRCAIMLIVNISQVNYLIRRNFRADKFSQQLALSENLKFSRIFIFPRTFRVSDFFYIRNNIIDTTNKTIITYKVKRLQHWIKQGFKPPAFKINLSNWDFKNLIYGNTNEKKGVGFVKIYRVFFVRKSREEIQDIFSRNFAQIQVICENLSARKSYNMWKLSVNEKFQEIYFYGCDVIFGYLHPPRRVTLLFAWSPSDLLSARPLDMMTRSSASDEGPN